MLTSSPKLLIELNLRGLDPSTAPTSRASGNCSFAAHGVRRMSPPERGVQRSHHAGTTHEVGEDLFIAASQNVAGTFGAAEVSFVKLQVVYTWLHARLGSNELLDDLKTSFLRLRSRGRHGTR